MAVIRHWLPAPADYLSTWQAMRDFTEQRTAQTPDELWLTEHPPVYTLGQAGKPEHLLNTHNIPVVHTDRGGQVTYHGPGQLMVYCLVDLRRYGLFVKEYVTLLEDALINSLQELGVLGATRKPGAPGVYVPPTALCRTLVPDATHSMASDHLIKIAALGIKIRQGCAYHGLALNVDMDLNPFQGINPCGYEGMETTDLRRCGIAVTVSDAGELLTNTLQAALLKRQT